MLMHRPFCERISAITPVVSGQRVLTFGVEDE